MTMKIPPEQFRMNNNLRCDPDPEPEKYFIGWQHWPSGISGYGEPMDRGDAVREVRQLNEAHLEAGTGVTHWIHLGP